MARAHTLLVVDDDAVLRRRLASLFGEAGYTVCEAASADAALEQARRRAFDAVLSDIAMPGKSGVEMVGELRRILPGTPIALMTASGSIESTARAMRAGACHTLTKPFAPEAALLTLERVLERRALEEENRRLHDAAGRTAGFAELVGESPAIRELEATIRRVAGTRCNAWIHGESGTGKEIVARTLHYFGGGGPFVPVDCAAVPEGLLERELFGHARDAFDGATTSRRGLVEAAHGGTLFLGAATELPPALQAELLRVLQGGEVRPVGATKAVRVDVRLVAASERDLRAEVEAGAFLRSLFRCLATVELRVPPLRERPGDIPLLAAHFLERHAPGGRRRIAPAAMALLEARRWRGNLRELENAIERALALSDGEEIGPDDLPSELRGEDADAGSARGADRGWLRRAAQRRLSLRELDDRYIDAILELTGGNQVRAARILGIDRKTLYRRGKRRRTAGLEGAAPPTKLAS